MAPSFSGGSQRLGEASARVEEKVKWTVRMAGHALSEVENLVKEAGQLGSNIQGINQILIMIQDINTDLNQHLIGKLTNLQKAIEDLR